MSSSSRASASSPSGRELEDAHVLEQEAHAAGGADVPAVLLEVHPDVGDGAHHVVRGRLHQHRDAVGSVALVEDDLVVGVIRTVGALDGRFDLVLGHVRRARVLQRPAKRGVVVGRWTACPHGNGDVLADPREQFGHPVPAGEHRRLPGLEDSSHVRLPRARGGPCQSPRGAGVVLRGPGRALAGPQRAGLAWRKSASASRKGTMRPALGSHRSRLVSVDQTSRRRSVAVGGFCSSGMAAMASGSR